MRLHIQPNRCYADCNGAVWRCVAIDGAFAWCVRQDNDKREAFTPDGHPYDPHGFRLVSEV